MFKGKRVMWACFMVVVSSVSLSADTIKPNGCKGPTLCSSFPIYDGCGWHVDAGLLVEKMGLSDVDIYYIHESGSDTVSSPNRIDTMRNVSFPMSPGVRAGVGKYFMHDDWMLNFSFEWLNSVGTSKDDLTNHGGRSIVPVAYTLWAGTQDQPQGFGLQKADVNLNTSYYLLDFSLSRGSYISGHFTYEPYGGIKTAWLFYNMKQIFWDPTDFSSHLMDPLDPNQSLKRIANTDFWGIGPMIGMKGDYYFCYGWSFFTLTNFSILYGGSSISDRSGVVTSEVIPTAYIFKDSFSVFSPTLRNIVGLQYDKDSTCEKRHYNVRFGFDARYYFNQYPIVEQNAYKLFRDQTTGLGLTSYPNVEDNNSFAMVGFLFEVGLDF